VCPSRLMFLGERVLSCAPFPLKTTFGYLLTRRIVER